MNGTLEIQSEEREKYNQSRKKDSQELFDFIDKKIHPRIRKRLSQLIEKYNNDYSDLSANENKLYYKAGFSDGIKMLLAVFNEKRGCY